jgi:hypothetical protein
VDKTGIAPMPTQQRRSKPVQDAGHHPRMILFLLDEKIHTLLLHGVSCQRRVKPPMPALAAFSQLKS